MPAVDCGQEGNGEVEPFGRRGLSLTFGLRGSSKAEDERKYRMPPQGHNRNEAHVHSHDYGSKFDGAIECAHEEICGSCQQIRLHKYAKEEQVSAISV